MKRLLLILILTLSFQSLTKADDIRDFEIEGMSVGDSALDFFTKNEIDNSGKIYFPNSKRFFQTEMNGNFKEYESITIALEEVDKKYFIHQITGVLNFPHSVEKCLAKQKSIKEEISLSFPNIIPDNYEFIYPLDKTGNSKSTVSDFTFDIGEIRVWCSDWSIEGYSDVVQVALASEAFTKFIETEAYKY